MRKALTLLFGLLLAIPQVQANDTTEHYVIDTQGMHAFISFRIKHLGFSWLMGRFNQFEGTFDYDEKNPANNKVSVTIDLNSLDTNHAERDKHLKSARFFDVQKFPKATFTSTQWIDHGDGTATLKGKFTLRGITKEISLNVKQIGAGKDPWGGFRRGFEGTTTLKLSDYKMKEAHILGPVAENVEIWVSLEGVRK